MAWYSVKTYDSNGKLISSGNEYADADYFHFRQAQLDDKRYGTKVRIHSAYTRDGMRIVTGYYCKDPDGSRFTMRLIDKYLLSIIVSRKY